MKENIKKTLFLNWKNYKKNIEDKSENKTWAPLPKVGACLVSPQVVPCVSAHVEVVEGVVVHEEEVAVVLQGYWSGGGGGDGVMGVWMGWWFGWGFEWDGGLGGGLSGVVVWVVVVWVGWWFGWIDSINPTF